MSRESTPGRASGGDPLGQAGAGVALERAAASEVEDTPVESPPLDPVGPDGNGNPGDLLEGLFEAEVHRAVVTPIAASLDDLVEGEADLIRKAVASRQREFAQGRVLARGLLAALGEASMPLLRDEDRVPIWPKGTVGCISHTKSVCAVVAGRSERFFGLGLDVEGVEALEPELRQRICTPRERGWLAGHDEPNAGHYAKAFFSVKESVYKACFPKLRERWGFQELEVELFPEAGTFCATPSTGAFEGLRIEGRAEARGAWWFAACALRAAEFSRRGRSAQ